MEPIAGALAEFPLGSRVVLETPRLGAAHARRLAELGLRPGTVVEILQRTPGDGRVVAVEDTRIALDRETLRALPASALPASAQSDSEPAAGTSR